MTEAKVLGYFAIVSYEEHVNTHLWFVVALSFMLVHEMDAIRRHEWKLFRFLSALTDERGYTIFTALHIPLYVLLLWGLFLSDPAIQQGVVVGFDIFCIIHIGLHALFIRHPDNQFQTWFSWMLILGAGVAGGVDLLLPR